jgi:hypothetical protein
MVRQSTNEMKIRGYRRNNRSLRQSCQQRRKMRFPTSVMVRTVESLPGARAPGTPRIAIPGKTLPSGWDSTRIEEPLPGRYRVRPSRGSVM